MTPAGLEKITEAKESGEWEAAIAREDVSSVPDDLVQALEEDDAWFLVRKLAIFSENGVPLLAGDCQKV